MIRSKVIIRSKTCSIVLICGGYLRAVPPLFSALFSKLDHFFHPFLIYSNVDNKELGQAIDHTFCGTSEINVQGCKSLAKVITDSHYVIVINEMKH